MFRVLVPIKQTVELDDEAELLPDGLSVDLEFAERDLNDWDTFSVEAAVGIGESLEDAEVVVVTVGDEESEEALVDCLARGADRAIRVPSSAISLADPLEVARVLASVAEGEEPTLILCGVQSSDAGSSATGIALAGFLGLRHVAVVRRIELDRTGGEVRLERELEGGQIEELATELPCLLTVQTGANEPRYATLRAIKQASNKPLEVRSLAELGLDEEALRQTRGAAVTRLSHPPRSGDAEMIEGSADDVADALMAILSEAGVLTGDRS